MNRGRREGERSGNLVRLGDYLPEAIEKIGPANLWVEAGLRRVWHTVVGETLARHSHVHRLRGHTLEIAVDADAWASEIRFLSTMVTRKLNAALGRPAVNDILVIRARKQR